MSEENNDKFIEPHKESEYKKDYKKNPFEKYSGKFRSSFGTLLLGMIFSIVAFVLLGYSEGVNEAINTIKRTPLIEVENLAKTSGLVKITGVPKHDEDLLYYKTVKEENRDGEWVTVSEEEAWANFKLGNISVKPDHADLIFDVEEKSRLEGPNEREIIYGASNEEKLIIIGEINNDVIDSGRIFLITNKTNPELITYLTEGGQFEWWLYKLGALFLLTLGITAFILPILAFLDIFPKFGIVTIFLIFLFSLVVSSLLVFISAIVITFWWLIFVIIALMLILLIRIKGKKAKKTINFVP